MTFLFSFEFALAQGSTFPYVLSLTIRNVLLACNQPSFRFRQRCTAQQIAWVMPVLLPQ